MTITCKLLLENHAQDWQEATVHPFLAQCQLGIIQPQQFNTWLTQDYLFVVEFTRMVGRVLASAPPEHFDVILGGLAALKDDLVQPFITAVYFSLRSPFCCAPSSKLQLR
jgi:thiaminase/transcriptional activator TenA